MGTIRSSSSTATPENIPNMNGFVLSFLALAVASASAFYDPATGVFTLGSMSLNGANALALGSTTVFLTSAGIAAAGLAILGAAVVKTALLEGGARSKREAPTETLEKIDEYFKTIGAMDVDDCGKLLVCTIETVSAEERPPEEGMIATLFGENATIDPASPKAEYDLAAYLGQATSSKVACARRYSRCPMDRKTISQALAKMARIQ